jgi:hypothetical protein
MKNNARKLAKRLIKLPVLNKIILSQKYSVERKLFSKKHVSTNENKSILHFTFNKTASQYIKTLLIALGNENGLVPVSWNDYAFYTNHPYLDHLDKTEILKYSHLFRDKGFVYSAFGGFVEGIDLRNFSAILTIRDPRDILVSAYYSMAYSHEIPPSNSSKYQEMILKRKEALATDINDFVLGRKDQLFDKFKKYQTSLLSTNPNVLTLKYEDMVDNFEYWVEQLEKGAGYQFSKEKKKNIIETQRSKKNKSEDVTAQRRKGIPGDYKKKLSPTTIRIINTEFSDVLNYYNYEH